MPWPALHLSPHLTLLLASFKPLLSSRSVFPQSSPSDSLFLHPSTLLSHHPFNLFVSCPCSTMVSGSHPLSITWYSTVAIDLWRDKEKGDRDTHRKQRKTRRERRELFLSFNQTLNVSLTFCTVSRQTHRQSTLCLSNLHTHMCTHPHTKTHTILYTSKQSHLHDTCTNKWWDKQQVDRRCTYTQTQ